MHDIVETAQRFWFVVESKQCISPRSAGSPTLSFSYSNESFALEFS